MLWHAPLKAQRRQLLAETVDARGFTVLHAAVDTDQTAIAKLLVDNVGFSRHIHHRNLSLFGFIFLVSMPLEGWCNAASSWLFYVGTWLHAAAAAACGWHILSLGLGGVYAADKTSKSHFTGGGHPHAAGYAGGCGCRSTAAAAAGRAKGGR